MRPRLRRWNLICHICGEDLAYTDDKWSFYKIPFDPMVRTICAKCKVDPVTGLLKRAEREGE